MQKDIEKLSEELLMTAVFRGVIKRRIFKKFFDYATRPRGSAEKISALGSFLSEIYKGGGNLSGIVKKYVFEDENVYVKMYAKGEEKNQFIEETVKHELDVFARFSSLTSEDFKLDSGLDFVPEYKTEPLDLYTLYEERIAEVGKFGYGIFASAGMFRLADSGEIEPIVSADKIALSDFVGYEEERALVIANTEAFIAGKPAANTLLSGDAGAGKSSTVKAIANAYFDKGVRLIELRKDQLSKLPYVMGKITDNPLKFIIFIDDLSFNQNDDSFSMLKAALEGSASAKASNAVIYATSNRRHIIKESFGDRDGDDVHRNDTMQETLSLSERFGLTVRFLKPDKKLYLKIVHELAARNGVPVTQELDIDAEAFALRRGARSARCAEHFVKSLV